MSRSRSVEKKRSSAPEKLKVLTSTEKKESRHSVINKVRSPQKQENKTGNKNPLENTRSYPSGKKIYASKRIRHPTSDGVTPGGVAPDTAMSPRASSRNKDLHRYSSPAKTNVTSGQNNPEHIHLDITRNVNSYSGKEKRNARRKLTKSGASGITMPSMVILRSKEKKPNIMSKLFGEKQSGKKDMKQKYRDEIQHILSS